MPAIQKTTKRLLSSTFSIGEIILWDVESKKALGTINSESPFSFVTFSEDEKRIFAISEDNLISVYDANTLSLIDTLQSDYIYNSFLSMDKTICFLQESGGKARFIRTSDLSIITTIEDDNNYKQVQIFSDNNNAVMAFSKGLSIYEINNRKTLNEIPIEGIIDLALSHDNKTIACIFKDNSVHLLDADNLNEIRIIDGFELSPKKVLFDPLDETLFIGFDGYSVQRYVLETGKILCELKGLTSDLEQIIFSKDNKYFITKTAFSTSIVWHTETNKKIRQIDGLKAINPEFKSFITSFYKELLIMPFYDTQMLLKEADRQLNGRTLTDEEKKELFITD